MSDAVEPNDDIEPDEAPEGEYVPTRGTLAHDPEFGDVDDDDAVDADDE